jgi:hypothetical protein
LRPCIFSSPLVLAAGRLAAVVAAGRLTAAVVEAAGFFFVGVVVRPRTARSLHGAVCAQRPSAIRRSHKERRTRVKALAGRVFDSTMATKPRRISPKLKMPGPLCKSQIPAPPQLISTSKSVCRRSQQAPSAHSSADALSRSGRLALATREASTIAAPPQRAPVCEDTHAEGRLKSTMSRRSRRPHEQKHHAAPPCPDVSLDVCCALIAKPPPC